MKQSYSRRADLPIENIIIRFDDTHRFNQEEEVSSHSFNWQHVQYDYTDILKHFYIVRGRALGKQKQGGHM